MPNLQWFFDNGCELQRPDPGMLSAIWALENGDPCRRCNCKDTCPAWPKARKHEPIRPSSPPRYVGFNVYKNR